MHYIRSRKINLILIFVLLALLFSMLTKLSKVQTVQMVFQLEVRNVPEEMVLSDSNDTALQLTLRSLGFNLLPYAVKEKTLHVDYDELILEDQYLEWRRAVGQSALRAQFDGRIDVLHMDPDTLKFYFETRGVKWVPVEVTEAVTFAPGYDLKGTLSVDPDSIKVIGPRSILDSLSVIRTEPIQRTAVNSAIDEQSLLAIADMPESLTFETEVVRIKGDVDKFSEGKIMADILLRNVPEGRRVNVYPKQVGVLFYASLDELKGITPDQFEVECDFATAGPDDTYLTARIVRSPEGLKQVRLETQHIDFIIAE